MADVTFQFSTAPWSLPSMIYVFFQHSIHSLLPIWHDCLLEIITVVAATLLSILVWCAPCTCISNKLFWLLACLEVVTVHGNLIPGNQSFLFIVNFAPTVSSKLHRSLTLSIHDDTFSITTKSIHLVKSEACCIIIYHMSVHTIWN